MVTRVIRFLTLILCLAVIAGNAWALDYRILDLGSISSFSYHFQINNAGQIVGPVGVNANVWNVEGDVRSLDSLLPYGNDNSSYAINDNGEVAIYSHGHIYSWSEATGAVDRNALPDSVKGCPLAINNTGDIVGWASAPYVEHACLWKSDGSVIDLGSGEAVDINDGGQILVASTPGIQSVRVLNLDGGYTIVDTITHPKAINNAGQVIGRDWQSVDPTPYMWTSSGGAVRLPSLQGWGSGDPLGISESGTIVGSMDNPAQQTRAVVWDPSLNVTALPVLPGHSYSYAYDINELGWVVGCSSIGPYNDAHLVVWQPVPEPASILALLCGIGGFGGAIFFRRK